MDEPHILAWHFLPEDRKLRWGRWKNPIVRSGVTYVHSGPVQLCEVGLHASVKALDALIYARGPIICRVECWDGIQEFCDKLVCHRRKVLWMADASRVLRLFACWCAYDAMRRLPCKARNPESMTAIHVAKKFANEKATKEELEIAKTTAYLAVQNSARSSIRVRDAGPDQFAVCRLAANRYAWCAATLAAKAAARSAARNSISGKHWSDNRDAYSAAAETAAWAVQEQKLTKALLSLAPPAIHHGRSGTKEGTRDARAQSE
jgi:hypothetical protein